jgi:hypothetical protein
VGLNFAKISTSVFFNKKKTALNMMIYFLKKNYIATEKFLSLSQLCEILPELKKKKEKRKEKRKRKRKLMQQAPPLCRFQS